MTKSAYEKSLLCEVKHVASGKYHFFDVMNHDRKRSYNVSIQVNCDCEHAAWRAGKDTGEVSQFCSHTLAVMRQIIAHKQLKAKQGSIHHDTELALQMRRNACLQYVRQANRELNTIRVGRNEGQKHIATKQQVCMYLKSQGKHFITEAILETGDRIDVLVLDDFRAIEIVDSENDQSLLAKRKKYPRYLDIHYIKVGEIYGKN